MRALATSLKTFKRDVFAQTHTATLEGSCYSADSSVALATFAPVFAFLTVFFMAAFLTVFLAVFLAVFLIVLLAVFFAIDFLGLTAFFARFLLGPFVAV